MRAFHADALCELADLAAAQHELLLQVGAFELLARFAQRQRQEVLFDERFVDRAGRADLGLDLLERDILAAAGQQQPANKVLEFAHVVGPGVVAQAILRRDAPERCRLLTRDPA